MTQPTSPAQDQTDEQPALCTDVDHEAHMGDLVDDGPDVDAVVAMTEPDLPEGGA